MRSPMDRELVEFVAHQIRAARENAGYTQQQLAEKIGISDQYMSQLENAKYSLPLTLLRNICNALSISPDLLIYGEKLEQNDPAFFINQIKCLDPKYIPPYMDVVETQFRFIKAAEQKQSDSSDK